jgi:hypothetical protein
MHLLTPVWNLLDLLPSGRGDHEPDNSYPVGPAAQAGRTIERMTRWLPPVLGALLVIIGAVWTLQGANLLGGSFMSGSRMWLVIGLVVLIAGVALLSRSLRARRARR